MRYIALGASTNNVKSQLPFPPLPQKENFKIKDVFFLNKKEKKKRRL